MFVRQRRCLVAMVPFRWAIISAIKMGFSQFLNGHLYGPTEWDHRDKRKTVFCKAGALFGCDGPIQLRDHFCGKNGVFSIFKWSFVWANGMGPSG